MARSLLVVCALSLVACDTQQSGDAALLSRRDSAGIEIVENTNAVGRQSDWTIPPEPVFRVGWESDDPQFSRIGSGFITEQTGAVVSDMMANEIHLISPAGARVETVGRSGEGPGEFGRIARLVRLNADSFLVADAGNTRVAVYEGARLIREQRVQVLYGTTQYAATFRTNRGFTLTPYSFGVPEGGASWLRLPILSTSDFEAVDTITVRPITEVPPQGNRNPVRQYGFTVPTRDGLVTGVSNRPEALWFDLDGALTRIARWDQPLESVDETDWNRLEEEWNATSNDAGGDQMREFFNGMREDFGGTRPLFGQVRVDREGNVWLGVNQLFGPIQPLVEVIASDGEWLGSVQLPGPARILDVTADHILLVEQNDLDMEAVALYRVLKP